MHFDSALVPNIIVETCTCGSYVIGNRNDITNVGLDVTWEKKYISIRTGTFFEKISSIFASIY
ncbi:hypothetical protein HZS_6547 [Henneguya salminicola]|nr:hypothetical protein HZS_6547 [Henneguya salminicola]